MIVLFKGGRSTKQGLNSDLLGFAMIKMMELDWFRVRGCIVYSGACKCQMTIKFLQLKAAFRCLRRIVLKP